MRHLTLTQNKCKQKSIAEIGRLDSFLLFSKMRNFIDSHQRSNLLWPLQCNGPLENQDLCNYGTAKLSHERLMAFYNVKTFLIILLPAIFPKILRSPRTMEGPEA